MSEDVAAFWGVQYPIRIGKDAPCFDWEAIHMPRKEQDQSDKALQAILLHEWGHRCVAPQTVAQGHWWQIIAGMEGIGSTDEAINVAADLIVDKWYLDSPVWGGDYRRALKIEFKELADLYVADGRSDPIAGLTLSCYQALGPEDFSFAETSQENRAGQALGALFNQALSMDERIRGFCRAVAPLFQSRKSIALRVGRSKGGKGAASPLSVNGSARWCGKKWDAEQLVRLIISSGLSVPEEVLQDICGEEMGRVAHSRLRVLESLLHVDSHLKKLEARRRTIRHEGCVPWSIGEPVRELETLMTVERFGIVLPGLTTVKKRYPRVKDREAGLDTVCLVVDNSGSTAGEILRNELMAAVGLLEACRRFKSRAGVIVFGSDIDAVIEPGSKYDDIAMLLAGLKGQSGGTTLAGPLWKAAEFAPNKNRKMATIIFTDSYICDEKEAVGAVKVLMGHGPVVFFCVERSLDSDFIDAVKNLPSPPRVIQHQPGKDLVDEALEVFM
jgi:hypothetical protein